MKTVSLIPFGTSGRCIVSETGDRNVDLHEYGLYNDKGEQVHTSYFKSLERAQERAKEEFPEEQFTVRDLSEEWEMKTAAEYIKRIKKLHPAFKTARLVLNVAEMYYNHGSGEWYTFIPFTHSEQKWAYRETGSEDWVERVQEKKAAGA